METKKYVSLNNMSAYTDNLKNIFATKESVSNIEKNMKDYILNIDCSILEFDTNLIISGSTSSALMGVGRMGSMILGNS